MPKGSAVQSMFAGIASQYDLANRVLSGGLDILWRRRLVKLVRARAPKRVVDLACGSGDVTFALRKKLAGEVEVAGMDFCQPMLDEAVRKRDARSVPAAVEFKWADCLALPLEDASVDVLTIAFGLRNLEDRARGLREMHRVLRPGGSLFVLEFTQPDRWFRPLYFAYVRGVLPWMARLLTGDQGAYEYLGGSIAAFPDKASLTRELQTAGFSPVTATGLHASIVAIHEGRKEQ